MNVRHELTIGGLCPVDGSADTYAITVEANRVVRVEDILRTAEELPRPLYQEEVTQSLASRLRCRVTSVGTHSGVVTTCVCEPERAFNPFGSAMMASVG